MANTQLLTGVAVGLGVGVILVVLFTGGESNESHSPTATARPQVERAEQAERPEATPHAGPNRALARINAIGDVSAKERGPHRSKMMEGADGFADKAPVLKAPPTGTRDPNASPSAAPADEANVVRPKMTWPLNPAGIQGAVRESLPDLRECYDAWVKLNPKIGGRVVVTFTIARVDGHEGGKVVGARVDDQGLGHAPMEGCIVQVFEDLRFERPEGDSINVTYPLQFSAGESDAGR